MENYTASPPAILPQALSLGGCLEVNGDSGRIGRNFILGIIKIFWDLFSENFIKL